MPSRSQRKIRAEDLYQVEVLFDPRLSPDGRSVIYTIQRVDPKTEKKYRHLWLAPTDGSGARQYTFGKQADSSPRWSPDGSQIAFLSNRGDPDKPAQLYLIPTGGGEARPLAEIPGEIGELSWSPDGRRLLCCVRKTDPDALERQQDEQKKKLGVVSRHYQRVFYKLDGYGYLPHERWHIWSVDTRSGKTRQLTDHPVFDEHNPSWSPDGKSIIFVSNRSADPDFHLDAIGLYVMPANGGEPREITAPVGEKANPVFSPDGRWIAYYGVEGEGEWYKNLDLWVVPADSSLPSRNLTQTYDLHVSAWTINDQGQAETMPPTWSNDGRRLYFQVVYHGSTVLKSIAVDGSDLQDVIGEGGVVGSFSFSKDQERLAYFYGSLSDPGQVYLLERAGGEAGSPARIWRGHLLTRHNRDWLDSIDLGEIETCWIQGPAGNDLQGWILKPPGFDPARQYPSILEIHGGPLTQYGFFFMHEFYYLAASGYVVTFCNPRGGRGYGEEHAKAIWGGWGGADYDDLMAWTDFVAGQPYIDTGRMGVTGGSYGGFMTVWIVGHTRRFKAAVTMRCVSNLISMWGSSDFNWIFQQELNNKPPFEDLQKFWDHSPIKYIGNASTPTLVIHNENDMRCPIEQGEQVFVALRSLGVESEMVRFPEEFHGLSRTGRTDRRIARLNHILRWFDRFMKDRKSGEQ